MIVNPCPDTDFSISRPALSAYSAVSKGGLTVEAYRSDAGQMLSIGDMHRISINRTGHRRYAFRLGAEGITHEVKRPAFSLGFQPAGLPLMVDGDGADYISIFQHPDLYRTIAPKNFAPEKIEARQLLVPADAVARHLACALAETTREPDGSDSMLTEQLGLAFAICTVRLLSGDAPAPEADAPRALAGHRLRRVLDYVEARLGESELSIVELAGVASLSAYHFSRAFRGATGRSPHRFVTERRIERAKSLLADRETSLADIAFSLGFSSQSHFSTVFRRMTGATPGAYREQL